MKTFLIADTHFGHNNIVNFLREDGSKLRPWDSIKEHDEALIENWNSVVKPCDKVYHLGDVGFKSATHLINLVSSLNGTKILIKGNHDNLKLSQYAKVFKDVRASHQLDGIVLSHIPLHQSTLYRWKGQIHGHTHDGVILRYIEWEDIEVPDEKYFNVSCERINYTPIDFEEVTAHFKKL